MLIERSHGGDGPAVFTCKAQNPFLRINEQPDHEARQHKREISTYRNGCQEGKGKCSGLSGGQPLKKAIFKVGQLPRNTQVLFITAMLVALQGTADSSCGIGSPGCSLPDLIGQLMSQH